MPILNMIAQGSGGGGGGSNVGEPTNLSAFVTSNTSIDIKWTDNNLQAIPPSTFQKSVLVRKVGSAPTTPSDGTTVVTETVMNTYQSSGYSDTGLTDGTTYYYQVFSYSTDGGITYGTPVSATPSGGWQPGANTLCYYTFDNTLADASGNHADASNISSCTFTDAYTGSTKKVLDKPNGSYIALPSTFLQTAQSTYTMLFWFKSSQNTDQWLMGCNNSSDYPGNVTGDIGYPGFGFLYGRTGAERRQAINTSTYRDGNWHLMSIRRGTGDVILGVDNNFTTTYELNTPTDYSIGGSEAWGIGTRSTATGEINTSSVFQLGDFITESIYWADSEVEDYYNQTKANYGIS